MIASCVRAGKTRNVFVTSCQPSVFPMLFVTGCTLRLRLSHHNSQFAAAFNTENTYESKRDRQDLGLKQATFQGSVNSASAGTI